MTRSFSRTALAALALAVLGATSQAVHAQTVTAYSGNAFGAYFDISGSQFTFADTGALPPDGGSLSASALDVFTVVGGVQVASATTSGVGGVATSSTALTGVSLLNGLFTADAVTTTTLAHPSGVSGSTVFTNVAVSGTPVDLTGLLNTTFDLTSQLGFASTVTFNRQVASSFPGHNEITVEALVFSAPGLFEIILGHAHSDVSFVEGVVPEPGTAALLAGLGATCLLALCRRRK